MMNYNDDEGTTLTMTIGKKVSRFAEEDEELKELYRQ